MTRVLIVDDSATMRGLIAATLRQDPEIEVVGQAADPLEAREAIKALNPDVITLDVEMPNMNGLDLVKLLRSRHISVPIILITGHPDEHISERAARAGVHHVLHKPLLDDSLIGHIRGALSEHSTRH